jgi:Putative phage serine protease XkdF
MSDYHKRFHKEARKALNRMTFDEIHRRARASTGGAAPRTPKNPALQPDGTAADCKVPVTKSAIDTISGMWSRTLEAITGRQRVEMSGLLDNLADYSAPAPIKTGPPLKNTHKKKKKKRVTKSALMSLAEAVADHDEIERDGVIAIQLGAEHGRTKGAIGIALTPQDKATIRYDLSHNALPLPDASVNHIYVRQAAVDAGIDLDALLPELRRVSAPGAKMYCDFAAETKAPVHQSGEFNEDDHPRADDGKFGQGGSGPKTSSGKEIPRADSKSYKTKKRLSNANFVKASQEKHPTFTKQDHTDAQKYHSAQQDKLTRAANAHIASHPGDFAGFGALLSAARDHEHAVFMHSAAQKSTVNQSAISAIAAAPKRAPKPAKTLLAERLESMGRERRELVLKSVTDDKPVAGVDTMRQIVYAPALVPGEISIKGHTIGPEEIEYSAHRYMTQGCLVKGEHGGKIDAHVVESFIAPQDIHFDGENTPYGAQTVPKGSWLVGIKVNDPSEWDKVMKGQYTGFSTGGDSYVRGWQIHPD